ncbi:MAG: response regulator [Desulfobacteraceae bacterium]|nr:response regulator [Desulfobacteraceae bacterium]MBC2720350.1 response regulator [Desulfobacteraceae bacterium]
MKDEDRTKKELIDDFVKVKQQLKKYSEMLDVLPDIVYKIDSDGHFVYLNGAIKSMGYLPEELIGKHFSKIIHPDDIASLSRSTVLKQYKGSITGDKNSPKLFDERRTEKRGTKHLIIRLIQKGWEREEDSKNVENSKTVYVEVMASGQYNKAISKKDKAFLGTFGIIRDMEKQKYVHDTAPLNDSRISCGEISSSSDSDGINEDRSDNKYDGTVGIIRDVTERKIFEQQKAKLEKRLQQARKMEAIGQLAAGIAHSFNNLLMAIQGNTSLMLVKTVSSHPHYEKLRNIEEHVRSASKLTAQLLGYVGKGKYKVERLDLNQVVEETSEIFARTQMGVTIHKELAEGLFLIEADDAQFRQILFDLYLNAAEAMIDSGDLILKTTNVTHEDIKGKGYDSEPGNYVLLTITDTGVGMDKSIMGLIFDPFFTTKHMGMGTGLGLASAYGIITGHGGYIDVESRKGHGSTFSIYFPASGEKVRKVLRTADEITRTTGTVLLVDDENMILNVEKKLLEALGHEVFTAGNGKEAVEVYKKKWDNIDLVLMDMVMPNMGGGEAYYLMKEINPNVKVLLSSGYSIDGKAKEILARGCNGFIQKPWTIKELSKKIREIREILD